MLSRLHTGSLLVVACLAWGVLLVADGVHLELRMLRPLSAVIGVTTLASLAFDAYLWRISWLRGWFVARPDLRGTWRIDLTRAAGLGEPADHRSEAYLAIRQTFSRVDLRLLTADGNADLIGASIHRGEGANQRLLGVYRYEPSLLVRDRRPIHYGTLLVEIHGAPPTRLEGHFWTDGGGRGTVSSVDRLETALWSYEDARMLFQRRDAEAVRASAPRSSQC